MRARRFALARACAWILCALPVRVHGQASTYSLSRLLHTSWTRKDGAPTEVFALAQTTDGYLWLGSSTGLFRFDGVTFERFSARVGASATEGNVAALFAASDGSLWIGGIFGGVSHLVGDSVTHFGVDAGLPANSVHALVADASGSLWAATSVGAFRQQGARWELVSGTNGLPAGEALYPFVDRQGTLWISVNERGTYARTAGSTRFFLRTPTKPGAFVGTFAESRSGAVWTTENDHTAQRVDGGGAADAPTTFHSPAVLTGIARSDADNGLWLGTQEGLERVTFGRSALTGRFESHIETFLHRDGLSGAVMSAMLIDREGTIWTGTDGGLDRFRPTKLIAVDLPPDAVTPAIAAASDSAVWAGTNLGAMFEVGSSTQAVSGSPARAQAVHRDASGQLWVGTEAGEVWHSTPHGFEADAMPSGVHGMPVQSIVHDGRGTLWISVIRSGVFRRDGVRWEPFDAIPELRGTTAVHMTLDTSDVLWLGYTDNRVARVAHGGYQVYSAQQRVSVGNVTAIHVARGHVWIGGAGGLQLLQDNQFRTVTGRDGALFRGVTGIVERATGELWLNGADGITRIPSTELVRAMRDTVMRVAYERFDAADGLLGVAPQLRPLNSAAETRDGRLWFATSRAVFRIDPAHIRHNRVPPPVQLRAVVAGGVRYAPVDTVRLPANTRAMQLQYTALSLAIPERVRFRYQLVGSDSGWQEAGARREAFYTNLRPGTYPFRVIAANDDGVWNEAGASMVITIPPTFTQTRAFLATLGIALALLLWIAYQLRLRALSGNLSRVYDARLAERTRIAQELHDTLLQGFTGITLRLQAVRQTVANDTEHAVRTLDRILEDADTTLRDARYSVWDIRSPELNRVDIVDALTASAESAIEGTLVALRVTVTGQRCRFATPQEVAVHRIGREAVVNAVRHANARLIVMAFAFESAALALRITDDGCGIGADDMQLARGRGHWGISGMRERAVRLGGTLDIARGEGGGTTVLLSLPMAPPDDAEHMPH